VPYQLCFYLYLIQTHPDSLSTNKKQEIVYRQKSSDLHQPAMHEPKKSAASAALQGFADTSQTRWKIHTLNRDYCDQASKHVTYVPLKSQAPSIIAIYALGVILTRCNLSSDSADKTLK